jgi:hypothetical protein
MSALSARYDSASIAVQQLVTAIGEASDRFTLVRPVQATLTADDIACSSSGCFPEIEVTTRQSGGDTVVLKAQAMVQPSRRLLVFAKCKSAGSTLRTLEIDLGAHFSLSISLEKYITKYISLFRFIFRRVSLSSSG